MKFNMTASQDVKQMQAKADKYLLLKDISHKSYHKSHVACLHVPNIYCLLIQCLDLSNNFNHVKHDRVKKKKQ